MQKQEPPDMYLRSGVYKLSCPDCNKAYIGQTGRKFLTRFKEHKRAAKLNKDYSNFAKHINTHAHSFGAIDTTMTILKKQGRGTHLNTLERFYIHKEASHNNHLNDNHTILPNKIFDTILKIQNHNPQNRPNRTQKPQQHNTPTSPNNPKTNTKKTS